MREKTKQFLMNEADTKAFIEANTLLRMGMIDERDLPYVVPLNYVFMNGAFYIHGASEGKKIDTLRARPQVCLEIDEMYRFVYDETGGRKCGVSTSYRSVIAMGKAFFLAEESEKRAALDLFVEKCAPELVGAEMPAAAVQATMVIKVVCEEVTGKAYHIDDISK